MFSPGVCESSEPSERRAPQRSSCSWTEPEGRHGGHVLLLNIKCVSGSSVIYGTANPTHKRFSDIRMRARPVYQLSDEDQPMQVFNRRSNINVYDLLMNINMKTFILENKLCRKDVHSCKISSLSCISFS